MKSVRDKRHAAIPGAICLLLGFLLLLTTSPSPPPASAQSVGEDKLKPALLGLQQEFVATLHEITPALLKLQKELVEELGVQMAGVEEEERVGQRTIEDVTVASQAYFGELELLQVMEARSGTTSISEKELLRTRIDTRSKALSYLQRLSEGAEGRYRTGEITRTDVALAKAKALKAEIMLQALKNAAGE